MWPILTPMHWTITLSDPEVTLHQKQGQHSQYPEHQRGTLNVHCKFPVYIQCGAVYIQCANYHWKRTELYPECTLKHALNSAVHTLKSPQWQCTGALNLHSIQLQCIFSAALNIPSSPRSVLHCRYPETTLNPHSTSTGVGEFLNTFHLDSGYIVWKPPHFREVNLLMWIWEWMLFYFTLTPFLNGSFPRKASIILSNAPPWRKS